MKSGIGYASVAAASSAGILCLVAAVVVGTDLLAAAGEEQAQDSVQIRVPATMWDQIRAMGWSGTVLLALLGLSLVILIMNLVNLRRIAAYEAPPGGKPADIAAAAERFLIAPGALLGTGVLAIVVALQGTATCFIEMLHTMVFKNHPPDPFALPLGIMWSLLPARYGLLLGALAIGAGLIFRGIVSLRRAKLVQACART